MHVCFNLFCFPDSWNNVARRERVASELFHPMFVAMACLTVRDLCCVSWGLALCWCANAYIVRALGTVHHARLVAPVRHLDILSRILGSVTLHTSLIKDCRRLGLRWRTLADYFFPKAERSSTGPGPSGVVNNVSGCWWLRLSFTGIFFVVVFRPCLHLFLHCFLFSLFPFPYLFPSPKWVARRCAHLGGSCQPALSIHVLVRRCLLTK